MTEGGRLDPANGPWPRRLLRRLVADDRWGDEFVTELDHEGRRGGRRVGWVWWAARLASPRTIHFVLLIRRRRRGGGAMAGARTGLLGDVGTDARHAARSLAREPRTVALVAVTLALGVGSVSAMYGVADRLFLAGPRHVSAHGELFRLFLAVDDASGTRTSPWIPYRTATALQERVGGLRSSALYRFEERLARLGLHVAPVRVSEVDGNYFGLLGPAPAAGGFFGAGSEAGTAVAVVSHALAREAFGTPDATVGRRLELAGDAFTVVGVAPEGFAGPHLERVDAWIPVVEDLAGNRNWWVIGRAPRVWSDDGVPERMREEAQAVHDATDPGRFFRWAVGGHVVLAPLGSDDAGEPSAEAAVTLMLFATMGLVLLLACGNVVNLLLARTTRRSGEITVRLALGSGRWRLVRRLVLESSMLALVGGLLSIGVAYLGGALLQSVLLPQVAWAESPVDGRVLAATTIVAMVAGVLVGLLPATLAHRSTLSSALASARPGSRPRAGLQLALATAQVALASTLLLCAGLFVHSFATLRVTDLGVVADEVFVVGLRSLDPGAIRDGSVGEEEAYGRTLDAVRAVDGFERAALAVGLPFRITFGTAVHVPGRDSVPELPGGGPYVSAVSDRYFDATGTPVRRGVAISEEHVARGERVTVVSESAAATLWPGADPLGRCVRFGTEASGCSIVVGVAADVHQQGYREPRSMQFYVPFGSQTGFSGTRLVVRPRQARAAPGVLRARLAEIPGPIDYVDVERLESWLDAEVRPWRLGAVVLSVTSTLAALVALLGVFGVLSYLVVQRRREIGVRMALGASATSVRIRVIRAGLVAGSGGVAVGFLAVVAGGRWLAPLLFETSVTDPGVMASVGGLLVCAAAVSCLLPAARASRVAPADCLREEG